MNKIIYIIEPKHSMVATLLSDVIFSNGYADFDIEDGHKHIPVENIVRISINKN